MRTIENEAVLNSLEMSIIHFCLYSCCSKILASEIYNKIDRINRMLNEENQDERVYASCPIH